MPVMTEADPLFLAPWQFYELIREAHRDDIYARLKALYNAGARGRELR